MVMMRAYNMWAGVRGSGFAFVNIGRGVRILTLLGNVMGGHFLIWRQRCLLSVGIRDVVFCIGNEVSFGYSSMCSWVCM